MKSSVVSMVSMELRRGTMIPETRAVDRGFLEEMELVLGREVGLSLRAEMGMGAF